MQTGGLVARLAEGPADLVRAQELRHLRFRAARGLSAPGGREVDRFDDLCQHVLIEDGSGRLLGGFRAFILPAQRLGESYSAQFYDLTPLSIQPGPMMELGRFCTHPEASDPDVLRLALAAITRLVETAGVTLLRADVTAAADALALARATVRVMRQNLFWAFFYNAIGIPLAAAGELNPVLASAAMALSSVSVLGNSLRLGRIRI